jgi:hypothetical protein
MDEELLRIIDLFDEDEVTTADKIDSPENPYKEFEERNPRADGGMLVQPGFGGTRQGYSGEYGPNIRASDLSNSFEVTIERGKKVFNKSFNFKKYGGEEKALEAAKEYRDEKRKLPDTRGSKKGGFGAGAPGGSKEQTGGKVKIEKILNNFIKQGKTSFSNADIRAKMNVENFYKSDSNFRRAVDVIKKQPKYKNLTFIKKPRVENPDEAAKATKKKRELGLKDTDPTRAKGTKKFNYHHIRQIEGGVPLTTDDVMIINQRINSSLGTKYDKPLNAISAAIQKNNRLALESMNAKEESLALEYMKRSDELNARAEKIVNSAIDKLPEKYKGYVGFNQFTLPRDEYGFPISNEPMIIRKVGGMPIRKDAIDLTTLTKKDETEFRKIVRAQAEAGKTGQIKGLAAFRKNNLQNLAAIGCPGKIMGGRIGFFEGQNLNACAAKGIQKLQTTDVKKLTPGDKANVRAITKTVQGGRLLKNVLGPGALAFEGLFAAPFAAYDYARGRPGIDVAKSALSLGLLDQKLTDAELKKIYSEYGASEKLKNVGDRLTNLERLQKGTRGQRIRSRGKFNIADDQFKDALEELKKTDAFKQTGSLEKAYLENIKKSEEAEQELQRQYDIRKQDRTTQFDLSDPFMAAGGGIAKMAGVDSGPPPEKGPMSQGLPGLLKRVKKG